MAPKSLPVINSVCLLNHKPGLNCLSISANCLPTSKAELNIERGRKKTRLPEAGAWQRNPPLRALICGLEKPGKVMASELLFAIKLMGASIPQSFPAVDTESLFTFRFLKLLPGSGWGQTPQWCIEEHVWEFLSHLKHIPENEDEELTKIWLMRPRLYCSLLLMLSYFFLFLTHNVLLMGVAIALTILCPLEIRPLSSALTLHFLALGGRSSKSTQRSLASFLRMSWKVIVMSLALDTMSRVHVDLAGTQPHLFMISASQFLKSSQAPRHHIHSLAGCCKRGRCGDGGGVGWSQLIINRESDIELPNTEDLSS